MPPLPSPTGPSHRRRFIKLCGIRYSERSLRLAFFAALALGLFSLPYMTLDGGLTSSSSTQRQLHLAAQASDSHRQLHDPTQHQQQPGKQQEHAPPPEATQAQQQWLSQHQRIAANATRLKYPIWWAAPFYSMAGYGQEAISYTLGMLEGGLIRPEDLWISQSGDGYSEGYLDKITPYERDFVTNHTHDNIQKVLTPAESSRKFIIVCHSFPDCWMKPDEFGFMGHPGCPCPGHDMEGKYVYKIGRSMFEVDRLPGHLVQHALGFDEIWVPSEFNRKTFSESGVPKDKIHLLPQGINTTVFDPALPHKPFSIPDQGAYLITGKDTARASKPYVFLSVFKWESRKGWEILIKAFLDEFRGGEGVELHIVTHPFMEKVASWQDKVREGLREKTHMNESDSQLDRLARIYLYDGYIPDEQYPGIYKAADALVVSSRGEGWGRPEMEAMSMGLPVIATNWSGLTSFVTDNVAYPLQIEGLVDTQNDGPSFFIYFKDAKWAQPSYSHLRQLYRQLYRSPDQAAAKGKLARQFILREYSAAAVAGKLRALIDRVEADLERRGQQSS